MEKKDAAYKFTDEEVNDLFGAEDPSGSPPRYEQLSLFDDDDDIVVTGEYGLEFVEKVTKGR